MPDETSPLIGRTTECAAVSRILAGTALQSVVIAGPSGVGRTRLAREALRLAGSAGRRTRWAAGTAAQASVPLGALAHLLPPMEAASDPLSLLQLAGQAVAAGGGERPPVLAVDDVHLLDQLSISLLHQLAASRSVSLVLTVRTSFSTPDPVASLWKDGPATRLELHSLSRRDSDLLIPELLGGDVDTRTSERLWRLSAGDPLFITELLAEGRCADRLHQRAGLWRWDGPMRPSQRLSEIALAQLGDLDRSEWQVLEVLAAGEPLKVDRVIELSDPDAVAALVRRGVVVEVSEGDSRLVQTVHPLYTEVIRQRTCAATLWAVRHRLVVALPLPTSYDGLRSSCAVLLDADPAEQDPEVLTEAAGRANALLDHPLAERLAEAAIRAGGGAQAHLALVEAAHWQGESVRSEQVATAAAPMAAAEGYLVHLAVLRAINLFMGLRQIEEASAVLQEAAGSIHDDEDWALVTATEAFLAFLAGRPRRATERAFALLSTARPDGFARPLAAAAAAAALAVTGRTASAMEYVATGWEALGEVPRGPEVALVRLALAQAEFLSLLYGGRIRELEERAAALHDASLAAPQWAGDGVIAFHRSGAALASGRVAVGIRWLVEALAGLEEGDPTGVRPLCTSELARARALLGDLDGARKEMAETQETGRQVLPAFRAQLRLTEALVAAAESREDEAGELALEAATMAGATEQWCVEALMLHAAARLGRQAEALPRIRYLAGEVDSPLVAACAAHVEAVVEANGIRLDDLSRRFADMGFLLLAAQTAADAVAAHEAGGERAAAAASRAAVAGLARRCEFHQVPGLDPALPGGLTSREEEVARQAAQGRSNQQIARDLVLSVRTVETHLAHAYAKLGIRSRSQLAELLDRIPTQRPRR